VQSQSNLFEIVAACHPRCGFTDLLNGRQQQTDQDGNNRNDDKQFDQREPTP
jgi:hypothetical protein